MVPNNILSAALEASWQASAGICLLLAARLIFGRFLSGRWLYVLWLVVMARLLLPGSVLPESPAPRAHAPVMSLPFDPEEDPTFGFHGLSLTEIVTPTEGGEMRITREAPLPPPRRLDKWQIAGFVWAAGALALAVYFLAATAWLRRRILREEKPTPAAVVDLWRQCCAHLAGHAPTLISSTAVKAPVLIGLFRPRLVLPDRGLDFLSDEDWRHIFFHELAHFPPPGLLDQSPAHRRSVPALV